MVLMTFDEFIKIHLGKAMDYDGVAQQQCVDLAKYYLDEVFGIKAGAWGDAYAYYTNFNSHKELTDAFTRIANTPEFVPQKGDIAVWGTSYGKWGHIAICDGMGDTTYFYSYDQNITGNYDACARIKHNYSGFLGVLRPKDQTRIKGTIDNTSKSNEVKNMSVTYKGIDISRYQGSPDFSKLKDEVDFIILQVGFGRYANQKDSEFERSYSECKKYGIPIGIYHYGYAKTTAEALTEAKACLEMIKGKQFEYPVYYDLEESLSSLGKNLVSAIATTFCNALEQEGYYAGIYMSRSPAQLYLTSEVSSRYALWLAEYGSALNWNGAAVGMWQNSSTGRFSGISGNVDTDICYIDYSTIIKNAGLNGYTKSTETNSSSTKETTLDTAGFKKGDKGYQALALKTLLKLAVDKKLITGKIDDTSGLGSGSIKIVNGLLAKWGYKQNGVAGTNFINKLYKELK